MDLYFIGSRRDGRIRRYLFSLKPGFISAVFRLGNKIHVNGVMVIMLREPQMTCGVTSVEKSELEEIPIRSTKTINNVWLDNA